MTDEPRDPLAALLDVVIYAPIGAVLHGPEAVEQLAAKGRQDVTNARLIGRMVLDKGRQEAERVAADAQDRLGDLLVAAARAAGAPMAGAEDHDDVDTSPGADDPAASGAADVATSGPGLTVVPGGDPVADSDAPDADSLAIPGYDTLSASQVVPRLDDLAGDELRAIQDYERAHRGRMTILSRIAQLQAS